MAIALLGLLAFSSFLIDYGVMMVSRGQAQTAADAGAMAAAYYLAWNDPSDLAGARAIGVAAAQANPVWGQPPDVTPADVTFPTCPPGAPGPVDTCVRVDVFRNQRANGNPLPVVFASLLGMANQGVRATATAQVLYGEGPGPGDCVKPFSIPDRWEEFREDQNATPEAWVDDLPDPWPVDEAMWPNEEPWDPDDEYNARFTQGGNRGELLNSLPGTEGEPIDLFGPGITHGPGVSGFNIAPNPQLEEAWNDNGILLALKHGNGEQIVPSWYYPFVVTDACGTGANCYRARISGCANMEGIGIGDPLTSEPGNMQGPTRQGMQDLMAQDQGVYWTPDESGYPRGTLKGGMGYDSPRLAMVPLFDPDIYMAGHQNGRIQAGNAELVVTKWAGIFFNGMSGNTVMGHLMPIDFTPTATNLSDDPNSFLRTAILVR